ncbi:outer membrane protein assembly factor BamB [Noviherbaspirillum pedocola]|uniref:Outer membrane protein assembly factor BamB n=1 Tax=Noviherbaspirillum pedocola TaxID=2801341 RepID=A0A934SPR1_9BURK|nr:outer membrane protein assembly factor BamB [Noviherbaspirillum pedocola]MBK4734461.1 outer membrane protein assembly factor BamB [Noviherbaspirillum pedocola]
MHIAARIAAACVALTVLGGCSTLQSINPFSSKVPRNPPAPLVDFKPQMTVRTAWTANIGKAGNALFNPAAVGSSVYVAAADGTIARFDAESGRQIWRINAGMPLTAGVGTDGVTVAVGAARGMVLAFDADGKPIWKAQASSEILSAPAVGQGLVIVRSLDNHIVAFDALGGSQRWTLERTTPALSLRSAPGIAVDAQSAYVGLPGGRLLALTLTNGGPRWEIAVGDPRGATELERISDVSGLPALVGSAVCAVAYQGRIGCVDAASGTTRWAKEFSSTVGVGADERFVFGADERGNVTAFTLDSGANVWRNTQLGNRGLATPVSYGRAVAVGDFQGYMHFLSREDGALLARSASDGSPVIGTPVVARDNLIYQTQAGTLVALKAE